MPLTENCIITINGAMDTEPVPSPDASDCIQLMTRGNFVHRGSHFYITYKETETTGYKDCTTVVKISDDGSQVTMSRFGPMASQLVIEKGVRHVCYYETEFGAFNLGVVADSISHTLGEEGGAADFSYTLDTESRLLSRNRVQLSVRMAN